MLCIPCGIVSLTSPQSHEESKSPWQTLHKKGRGFGFELDKFISGLQCSHLAAEWLILSTGSAEAQAYQAIEIVPFVSQCCFKSV